MSTKTRKKTRKESRVTIQEIRFTQVRNLPPAPEGTVRIVNYGSRDGRVGRPRKVRNAIGLAV